MNEFPVFIPHAGEHLAGVVTVPDDQARGLVLLLTGTGAPRSHRFQMWTRVARSLSDRGVASIRADYKGVGDSTGRLSVSPLGHLPKDQALDVARFGLKAAGVDKLGVLGNCSGSLVAMALTAETQHCVAAVCILPRVLQPSSVNRVAIAARRSKLAAFVRSNETLSAMVDGARGRKGKPSTTIQSSFSRSLDHARLLFLYSREDRDAYNDKSVELIDRMLGALPRASRERFEMQILPRGPLSGFESLGVQQTVLGIVVDWLAASFDGDVPRAEALRSPAAAIDQ